MANDSNAQAGLMAMRAATLEAEGQAAAHKAELLHRVSLKFRYTIERSENELSPEVSSPFLPDARAELETVENLILDTAKEATAKLAEAKAIYDMLNAEIRADEWPAFIH